MVAILSRGRWVNAFEFTLRWMPQNLINDAVNIDSGKVKAI